MSVILLDKEACPVRVNNSALPDLPVGNPNEDQPPGHGGLFYCVYQIH